MTKDELLRKGYKLTMVNTEGLLQSIMVINNDTVDYHGENMKRSVAINDALSRMHSIDNKVAVNGSRDLYALLFGDTVVGKAEDELEVIEPKYSTDRHKEDFEEDINDIKNNDLKPVEPIIEKTTEETVNKLEDIAVVPTEETKAWDMKDFSLDDIIDDEKSENLNNEEAINSNNLFDLGD